MQKTAIKIRTLVQDFWFETGLEDAELEERINSGWDGDWEIINITVNTTYSQGENEVRHHRIVTLKKLVNTEQS